MRASDHGIEHYNHYMNETPQDQKDKQAKRLLHIEEVARRAGLVSAHEDYRSNTMLNLAKLAKDGAVVITDESPPKYAFCCNCRHFSNPLCKHPESEWTDHDVIWGGKETGFFDCRHMRKEGSACGPSGKLFDGSILPCVDNLRGEPYPDGKSLFIARSPDGTTTSLFCMYDLDNKLEFLLKNVPDLLSWGVVAIGVDDNYRMEKTI